MDRNEIRHIAEIAMLSFTDEELRGFDTSFNETMELISKIKSIDTKDLEGTFQVNEMPNHWRSDIVGESLTQKEATANTATEKYGYFEIMKFVE